MAGDVRVIRGGGGLLGGTRLRWEAAVPVVPRRSHVADAHSEVVLQRAGGTRVLEFYNYN